MEEFIKELKNHETLLVFIYGNGYRIAAGAATKEVIVDLDDSEEKELNLYFGNVHLRVQSANLALVDKGRWRLARTGLEIELQLSD